jgi:hypothetical protein
MSSRPKVRLSLTGSGVTWPGVTVTPKRLAKHAVEATLSVAGTLGWSKRIVTTPLQMVCSMSGCSALATGSCLRLASLTIVQGVCQEQTVRGVLGPSGQDRAGGLRGGAMDTERRASPQGAKATPPAGRQPANMWAPPAAGRRERRGVITGRGG